MLRKLHLSGTIVLGPLPPWQRYNVCLEKGSETSAACVQRDKNGKSMYNHS